MILTYQYRIKDSTSKKYLKDLIILEIRDKKKEISKMIYEIYSWEKILKEHYGTL